MAFSVTVTDHHLEVSLAGLDALLNLRRRLRFPLAEIAQVEIAVRGELADPTGATLAARREGRTSGGRRVGPMLGGTAQREFWAVSESAHEVVWITLSTGEWSDVVVEHPDPAGLVARLTES